MTADPSRAPSGPHAIVDHAITSRRSIRAYLPTPVPRALLELQRTPPAVRQVPLLEVDTLLVWRRGYAAPAFRAWCEQLGSAT